MNQLLLRASTTALLALLVATGCSGDSDSGNSNNPGGTPHRINRPAPCYGKCDGAAAGTYLSPYMADLNALNEDFGSGGPPIEKVEDLYAVRMTLGEVEFTAPTHLFGGYVNLIPYSDTDNVTDASGKPFERRDEIIAKLFPPGDVGYMIKHHRPEVRTLDVASADGEEMALIPRAG